MTVLLIGRQILTMDEVSINLLETKQIEPPTISPKAKSLVLKEDNKTKLKHGRSKCNGQIIVPSHIQGMIGVSLLLH